MSALSSLLNLGRWLVVGSTLSLLGGCITWTVLSVTASAATVAAEAAYNTVSFAGKGIGMAADALTGDDEPAPADHSGVAIHYNITPAPAPVPAPVPAPLPIPAPAPTP